MNILAADVKLYPDTKFTLFGPLGDFQPTQAPNVLTGIISTAIGVMTVIAFIWFIFQFIVAAIQIISSGGDKGSLTSARQKLTTSIIGVVVVISAIFIFELIGFILGFSIITSIVDLALTVGP